MRQSEDDAPFFVSLEEIPETRTIPTSPENGRERTDSYLFHDYFGESSYDESGKESGPHAFLVDVPVNTTAPAHFHDCNQFQIFYPAAGVFYKRHPVERTLLHYTDAFSAYGPFGTHENPLVFHTLRQNGTSLTGYVPQDRDKLVQRSGRNLVAEITDSEPDQDPGSIDMTVLIQPTDDHLAAYSIRAGSSATMMLPSASRSGGQYICVLSGSLVFRGTEYPTRSVGWAPPGSNGIEAIAGTRGTHVLVLQFPQPA
jgi:hypothetical protein